MKTKKIIIKNSNINLKIDELDFSNTGIYFLKGNNGSGKTSIIEKILKENKVSDLNDSLENSISYYSQKQYIYNISVDKYIDVLDKEKLSYYLELFDIKHLNGPIDKLSGGELTKLKILRTILKDTSIIIFDEPTNNLDKKSVLVLKNILEEIRKEKTIILISHDERLDIEYDYIYEIKNNELFIVKEKNKNDKNVYKYNKNLDIDKNYFKYILNSTFNYFLLSITIILLVFISNYNASYLQENVQVSNERFKSDKYMEVLNVGEQCSYYYAKDLVELEYSKYCNDYDKLTLSDLITLINENYIENIYVKNELESDFDIYENKNMVLFSLPNFVSENQPLESNLTCTSSHILKGRLPKDNKLEVVLSKNSLIKRYNYKGDINNAIGSKVDINNKSYEIVGITNSNAICLSFNDNSQNGFITFNKKNIKYFDSMIKEMKKQNMEENFSMIYIKFKENKAEEASNKLIQLSKSHQISSNFIFDLIEKDNFLKSLPYLLIVNVFGFSLILTIVFILIRKTLTIVNDYMDDYKNLTFEFRKIDNALIKVILVNFLVALISSLISIFFIYNLTINLFWLIAPFYLIHLSFIFIFVKIFSLKKWSS